MANVKMSRRATLALAIVGASGFSPRVAEADAENRTEGRVLPRHSAATPAQRDLKMVRPQSQVAGIGHAGSTFEIETADGRKTSFSETSLRFKIDSSEFGPPSGQPVILPGGMIGDRATVFVASPAEIGMLLGRHD
jgi:cytochrome c